MTPGPRPPSSPGRGRPGSSRKASGPKASGPKASGAKASGPKAAARRTTGVSSDVPAARIASSKARLTGRATVLFLVAAVLAVSYASSMRAWIKQRGEINDLTARIAAQKADVAGLQQAQKRWHDPAYIEIQARLRFGWLMPGDTGYRVIGADGKVLSDGGSELSEAARPETKQPPQWWQSQWGSVVEAGKTASEIAAESADAPARKPAERIGRRPGDRSPGSTDR